MNNHAAMQLAKRYGKEISQRKILQKLRAGDYIKRTHTESPRRWIYDINYDGDAIRLIADDKLTAIITFLPPESLAKKADTAHKNARRKAPRVDDMEEAFVLEHEREEEEQALGLQLDEARRSEAFWRKSLIEALQKIQQLESQIDDQNKLDFLMQK